MRPYELMIIASGSLDDGAVSALNERVSKQVENLGGTVERVDHWGKRQFAYEIQHMHEGYYTVFDLQLPPDAVQELERQLRIADEVVRHKLIRPGARQKRAS
jgi:small subunit ribosomal protein S6